MKTNLLHRWVKTLLKSGILDIDLDGVVHWRDNLHIFTRPFGSHKIALVSLS